MAHEDIQIQEQLAKAAEQLSTVRRAVAGAVDRLSRIYNTFQISEHNHGDESVPGVKVRHMREVGQVARDLAFAMAQ